MNFPFKVPLQPDWIEEPQPSSTAPATFFRQATRCGPFQISLRSVVQGPTPSFDGPTLEKMAADFGLRFQCGPPLEQSHGKCAFGDFGTALFSLPPERSHGQVWFLANEKDLVMATYMSAKMPNHQEVREVAEMVSQITMS